MIPPKFHGSPAIVRDQSGSPTFRLFYRLSSAGRQAVPSYELQTG